MNQSRPLDGIKVLEMGQLLAGPFASCLLGYFGAEVIKIESPKSGDPIRSWRVLDEGTSLWWRSLARNKKCITINLREQRGRDLARRLADQSDVLIENFRPGTMEKWGLDPDALKQTNPQLIYTRISGFGQTGPNANLPATDSVMQAFSGLMSINKGSDGLPQRINLLAIDVMTGLYGFQAVTPALYRRALEGGGTHIKTSLMEAVGAFQSAKMIEYELEGGVEVPLGVPVAMFATKDGFLNINGRRDEHFVALCQIAGLPELAEDPRYRPPEDRIENEADLMPPLRTALANMTMSNLLVKLIDADVLHARVQTYGDYFQCDHVRGVQAVRWIEQSGVGPIPMPTLPGIRPLKNGDPMAHAPHLGEHSREILLELGHTDGEVRALVGGGAIGLHSA